MRLTQQALKYKVNIDKKGTMTTGPPMDVVDIMIKEMDEKMG